MGKKKNIRKGVKPKKGKREIANKDTATEVIKVAAKMLDDGNIPYIILSASLSKEPNKIVVSVTSYTEDLEMVKGVMREALDILEKNPVEINVANIGEH